MPTTSRSVTLCLGEALRKRGIAIFNDLRQGVQDIDFLLDPNKAEIRVGATEPIMAAIVVPAINRLSRKYPTMFFHVVAGDTSTLYRDVTERNIELAICRMIGPLPDELSAEIIFHDTIVVTTATTNPLTRRRKLTLADLANEPWVLYPPDSLFGSLVVNALRANGYEPPRATTTSVSFNIQMELLATGRFLKVLPGFMLGIPGRNPPLKGLPVALRSAKMPVSVITVNCQESDAHAARATLHRQCSNPREGSGEIAGQADSRWKFATSAFVGLESAFVLWPSFTGGIRSARKQSGDKLPSAPMRCRR